MIPCKPGDVVLVHFPFTSLRKSKKRPAVVISNTAFSSQYGDVAIMALTSVEQAGDFALDGWESAGLVKPTWIKPLLATIEQTMIEKPLGRLSSKDSSQGWQGLAADSRWHLLG